MNTKEANDKLVLILVARNNLEKQDNYWSPSYWPTTPQKWEAQKPNTDWGP